MGSIVLGALWAVPACMSYVSWDINPIMLIRWCSELNEWWSPKGMPHPNPWNLGMLPYVEKRNLHM